MESRWYLEPGQTLSNTKISDRSIALHIPENCWKKITGHLDRKLLAERAIDKEKARRKAMKDESEAMVESWDNSVMVYTSIILV